MKDMVKQKRRQKMPKGKKKEHVALRVEISTQIGVYYLSHFSGFDGER